MTSSRTGDFSARLAAWQRRIEVALESHLPDPATHPYRLHEALRYSVLGGGKRVRPVLVYATAATLGLSETLVDGAACAVEFIHAYSLVHDDLPAMDDDDIRRGRPACHKAYDEATAILVGDALQVLAFEVLAAGPGLPDAPGRRLELIRLLAAASGTAGMAGGQALDLAAQGRILTVEQIEDMHARKTGALIRASVLMAAACADDAGASCAGPLDRFATAVGLAFQIEDDLLDVEGDPTLLGKATGVDRRNAKPTHPAVVGVDASRRRAQSLHRTALEALAVLGDSAEPLREVSHWLLGRRH